ncbi:hypothetical protein EV702DRAFT_1272757 [Suillus placidus]|uniref:Uncharacterized protein n=1 Tax=Suillus placidus TaxID=48579 RepID=A0A9P7CUP0_9AGAM|nr:hypothetical protein EV702DRAFT_1052778 [Suillus placidus]KAG1762798.1 hypothetical protein EV702DRAFT_1272757 [Suillus placidus]
MDISVNKRYGVCIEHSPACSDKLYSPVSPAIGDKTATCKNGNVIVKRPKLKELNEPMYPLPPPFHQTPSPVVAPQSYLQRLILERWEAEVKGCEHAKKLQLLELVPERWEAEVRHCEEAKRAQLLELVLAAHGQKTVHEKRWFKPLLNRLRKKVVLAEQLRNDYGLSAKHYHAAPLKKNGKEQLRNDYGLSAKHYHAGNIIMPCGAVTVTRAENRPRKKVVQAIAGFVKSQHATHTGIVYGFSKLECKELAEQLRNNYGLSAKHYHAGMDSQERSTTQEEWQRATAKRLWPVCQTLSCR